MSELDDLEEIELGISSHGSSAKRSRHAYAQTREIRRRAGEAPKWMQQLRALKSAKATKAKRA